MFDEDILGITNSDLKTLDLDPQQFDGLGLLHVEFSLPNGLLQKDLTVLFIEQSRNYWQPFLYWILLTSVIYLMNTFMRTFIQLE